MDHKTNSALILALAFCDGQITVFKFKKVPQSCFNSVTHVLHILIFKQNLKQALCKTYRGNLSAHEFT